MEYRITLNDWSAQRAAAEAVRHDVFIIEQRIPVELEWDEIDAVSLHAIAYDGAGQAIGTGRLLPDGHIGRMAVKIAHRNAGIGSALLTALMQQAKTRGDDQVMLNSQRQVQAFYERHGFAAEGDEFMEAGIPHIHMRHRF